MDFTQTASVLNMCWESISVTTTLNLRSIYIKFTTGKLWSFLCFLKPSGCGCCLVLGWLELVIICRSASNGYFLQDSFKIYPVVQETLAKSLKKKPFRSDEKYFLKLDTWCDWHPKTDSQGRVNWAAEVFFLKTYRKVILCFIWAFMLVHGSLCLPCIHSGTTTRFSPLNK